MSTVAFPNARSFYDLFDVTSLEESELKPAHVMLTDWMSRAKKPPKVAVPVGPFCSIRRPGSYTRVYVHPTDAVLKVIEGRGGGDPSRESFSFKIIVRDDGTALVIAEPSLILGGIWLAIVDAASVPDGV